LCEAYVRNVAPTAAHFKPLGRAVEMQLLCEGDEVEKKSQVNAWPYTNRDQDR
jgi:hypothetical protein